MTRPREKARGWGLLRAAMAWQGGVSGNKCTPSPRLTALLCLSAFGLIEPELRAGDPQKQFPWVSLSGAKEHGEGWRADPEQHMENIQAPVSGVVCPLSGAYAKVGSLKWFPHLSGPSLL